MLYYLRIKSDKAQRRWKVRKAVSLRAAYNEVIWAMASGSIGGTTTVTDVGSDGRTLTVEADVIRVNSDNTEARPYEKAY